MIIKIPVSIGEVIDKISILLIKMEKITDIHKIQYINTYLTLNQLVYIILAKI